jgi:hypothetical protein
VTTRDALNSTVFLALARLGVPVLLAGNIAAGSYWAKLIYERQELAFMAIGDLRVTVDGEHAARLTEIERRLNSRRSPISDERGLYSIGGPL